MRISEILALKRKAAIIPQPSEAEEKASIAAAMEGINGAAKTGKEWIKDWLPILVTLPHTGVDYVNSDDLRRFVEGQPDFYPPPHPNVWGALIHKALRFGFLEDTGVYERSKRAKSHSHIIRTYRVHDPEAITKGDQHA